MCPYRTAKFEETASTCGADTIDVTSVDSRGNKAWKQDVCTDTGKLMRRMAVEQRTADKARSRVSLIFEFFALGEDRSRPFVRIGFGAVCAH